jgi:hypothetical protein
LVPKNPSVTVRDTPPDRGRLHLLSFDPDMAIPSARLPYVLTAASALIGTLTLTGGIYGLADPVEFSKRVGLPAASADSPALRYIRFAAARNVASGITLLAFLFMGQRKLVGRIMMCGVAVAVADAWIYARFGVEDGKTAGHVIGGFLVCILGWGMYYYGG